MQSGLWDRSICPNLSAAVPMALVEGIKEKRDADIPLFNRTWAFCHKLGLHCWQRNLSWPRRYWDIHREKGCWNETAKMGIILQPDLFLPFIANKKAERDSEITAPALSRWRKVSSLMDKRERKPFGTRLFCQTKHCTDMCFLSLLSGTPALLCHVIVRVEISPYCHYG